uniref:Ricin B lectin domain-containing protein n=1 Tax=Grammatophora oceanica TaxID=210454 RepID=A0A7S1VU73_9STRA
MGFHIIVDGASGGIEAPTSDNIIATKISGSPCVAAIGNHTIGEFELAIDPCVDKLAEQYYTFEKLQNENYYRVRVGSTGRCMQVLLAGTTSGDEVIQGSCDDSDHQLWELSGFDDDQQLKNKNSGLCLTVQFGSSAPGTIMIQSGCAPGVRNTFRISEEL